MCIMLLEYQLEYAAKLSCTYMGFLEVRALKVHCKSGDMPHMDQRGKHVLANKTSEEDIRHVKEHISNFPQYQSHYSRSQSPHRMYVSPELTIAKCTASI